MPRPELEALQLQRLRWSVAHARHGNPVYRARIERAGATEDRIASLDDLRRLPFTTKASLREHYPTGLFAVPLDQVVRIHASSGTRGKPTVVGYTRKDLATWSEVMARCLAQGGARPGTVLHVAYGYGLFTGGLGFHMGGELLGCRVIPMSSGNTARQILMMRDIGSQMLGCTPSYALTSPERSPSRASSRASSGWRAECSALSRGPRGCARQSSRGWGCGPMTFMGSRR